MVSTASKNQYAKLLQARQDLAGLYQEFFNLKTMNIHDPMVQAIGNKIILQTAVIRELEWNN